MTKGTDVAQFKADVDIVTIDVAVIDNKGHFIPGIPPGNFRVLEDNVPQQIRKVDMGEAPMTIALVIEFSNLFQTYWSAAWYQTLQLAWGFAESLKPEDYAAVVAYDIRPEILADFTTDKMKIREGLDRLKIAAFSRSEHVRRRHRHRRSHERNRRPQGHPADHQRHRYVQQDYVRSDPQETCRKPACRSTRSA